MKLALYQDSVAKWGFDPGSPRCYLLINTLALVLSSYIEFSGILSSGLSYSSSSSMEWAAARCVACTDPDYFQKG